MDSLKLVSTRILKLCKLKVKLILLCRDPISHKTLQKCPSTKLEEKRPVLKEQPQKNTMEELGVSGAPTIPVRRRLAWDAENTNEDIQKPRRKEQEERERDKQVYMGELDKLEVHEKSKADKKEEG